MFNDRDLGILGAGALLAVLCLFLPLSFAGKVVIGFLVLIGFMALALLRLGPDRVPLEVWLTRRFRYSMQTRQYVNQNTATRKTESVQSSQKQKPDCLARSCGCVLCSLAGKWWSRGTFILVQVGENK